ncbi:hypothetical protein B0H66DRAFT_532576 [Apodospora peruviana]|uniref:Uncharacterized protein n=1 Tax=Apodospora peruviana TaxID=516989 RepID=A0AAE0M3U4_9PEZI|nr:hypothetical protein B0H66DRAFT_532576 [Apodospora peruviana]
MSPPGEVKAVESRGCLLYCGAKSHTNILSSPEFYKVHCLPYSRPVSNARVWKKNIIATRIGEILQGGCQSRSQLPPMWALQAAGPFSYQRTQGWLPSSVVCFEDGTMHRAIGITTHAHVLLAYSIACHRDSFQASCCTAHRGWIPNKPSPEPSIAFRPNSWMQASPASSGRAGSNKAEHASNGPIAILAPNTSVPETLSRIGFRTAFFHPPFALILEAVCARLVGLPL